MGPAAVRTRRPLSTPLVPIRLSASSRITWAAPRRGMTSGKRRAAGWVCIGARGGGRRERASGDPGEVDRGAVRAGGGDGRLDEGHAGDAVDDAGVLEGSRHVLAPPPADGPFQGAVQVGQRLVET